MRRIRELIFRENGQSLVFVALLITSLLGFAGFAIDGGRLYVSKSQIQNAVDAGVLAGADKMLKSLVSDGSLNYGDSKTIAEEIADLNYTDGEFTVCFRKEVDNPSGGTSLTDCVDANTAESAGGYNIIEVAGTETVSLFLMPLVGVEKDASINASAQVKIGSPTKVAKGLVLPIGIQLPDIEDLDFGTEIPISNAPGDQWKGNYNFLNFGMIDNPSTNNANLSKYIEEGSGTSIELYQYIHTETGVSVGQVEGPIDARAGDIVYIPIVGPPEPDPDKGGSRVQVIGFAAMEIVGYFKKNEAGNDTGKNVVKAIFREMILPGDIGDIEEKYGTYTSKLIK
jgi:Flp pilus assembly protein TadG